MTDAYLRSQLQQWAREMAETGDKRDSPEPTPLDLLHLDLPNLPKSSRNTHRKVSYPRSASTPMRSSSHAMIRKKGAKTFRYRDSKSQEDLREEIMRLRKRVQVVKKESATFRTQVSRLQHKIREKDANLNRILNFQIGNGKDGSGLVVALRNEKLLSRMLMKKVSDLEAKAKVRDVEAEERNKKLCEAKRIKKEFERLQDQATQDRNLLRAISDPSFARYEEEISRTTSQYLELQRQYDILSTQHLSACKVGICSRNVVGFGLVVYKRQVSGVGILLGLGLRIG
ncbi:hypothetical protein AAMO2058_000988700 [Amorphochlora amoebiformis]